MYRMRDRDAEHYQDLSRAGGRGGDRASSSAIETVDKQVVFVVSVDDKGLRRHLVAKKTERSREEGQLAIRRYVDEYLAKFFSARLPIRAPP